MHLLDVNVLVALGWPTHQHHSAAHRWFAATAPGGWATCPMTQAGFVRVSCNARAVGAVLTPARAVALIAQMTTDPRHVFWADDLPLGSPYFVAQHLTGHQQITDAYLLALCASRGSRLATFDAALGHMGNPPDHVTLIPAD